MGFEQRSNLTYITIFGAKLAIRAQPDAPGAIKRTNKQNKVVWEYHYDRYSGFLVSFSTRDGRFGKELTIYVRDDQSDAMAEIQVPYSSRYAQQFLATCPNFNIHAPIKFAPYKFQPEDRATPLSGWSFHQGGKKLEPAFKLDQMPPLREVMFKGQKQYDDTDRMNFLWNRALLWASSVELFHSSEPAHGGAEPSPEDFGHDEP